MVLIAPMAAKRRLWTTHSRWRAVEVNLTSGVRVDSRISVSEFTFREITCGPAVPPNYFLDLLVFLNKTSLPQILLS